MTTNAGKQASSEPEWAAFVAIDWADRKHFWKLASVDAGEQDQGELDNSPEAIDVWAMQLHGRFGGRPIAVCLEQSRGAVVCCLSKYPHLVLFPVHPQTAAQYRLTFRPSGAKSDPGDADSLLDLLLRHREKLTRLVPDTVETRLLQSLVEDRRRAVDEKTRHKNRLTACLKIHYPQILKWFNKVDSPLVTAFLRKWGSLQEAQRAHPGTLRRFFHQANCRNEKRIEERIAGIRESLPATGDLAILEAGARKTRYLVDVIETLQRHIALYDERIDEVVASHPDASLFASLPGAGRALTPRLIVAFGTRRERFASAQELQNLSGIAPVTERSGKTVKVHKRYGGPTFLRQTFHEWATHSRNTSEWARAYYESQRAKGKKHHATVRSLAFKWIRIGFRCWKNHRPYDEQLHLQSLQKRHSPLQGVLGLQAVVKWTAVAGFQNISAAEP